MFEGLIKILSDQLHEDFDGLLIDGPIARMTHEQVIRFAKNIQVTLGDQLMRMNGPMQDRLIILLKRIQAVEAIEPVDLMKLMTEFYADPLKALSPIEKLMIGLFMTPAMGEA
jgi:hypothetical protein